MRHTLTPFYGCVCVIEQKKPRFEEKRIGKFYRCILKVKLKGNQ